MNEDVKIPYTEVKDVLRGGFFLKNLKFVCRKKYIFRGLAKLDLQVLESQFFKAEKNAWHLKLRNLENNISLISTWISDIDDRKFFQRESVFKKNLKLPKATTKAISGRVPRAFSNEPLAKDLLKIRKFLKSNCGVRSLCNREYIQLQKDRHKGLFDSVESNPLTDEQRLSVVTDEDANLVVAAAGSGKTSVLVAKAAWLLSKGLRKPNEILLLAFVSDARMEMDERLKERIPTLPENAISVHTFHSLGKEILQQGTGVGQSVSKLATYKVALQKFYKRHNSIKLTRQTLS